MKKLINLLFLLLGFGLHAQECDTVSTLPWFNNFTIDFGCWTQYGVGNWTLMNGDNVRASINVGEAPGSALLVSQPITIGSDTTGWRLSTPHPLCKKKVSCIVIFDSSEAWTSLRCPRRPRQYNNTI